MNDHYFTADPSAEDRPRELELDFDGTRYRVTTNAGVFSPTRLDAGTAVLLRALPDEVAGDVLDLGCGWGPIGLFAAHRAARAGTRAKVWALDVNQRALELVARNAEACGFSSVVVPVTADQVDEGQRFDEIWSNPPIRVGKDVLHSMLGEWIPRLRPGGRAMLVVAKHLGAKSLMTWLAEELGDEFSVVKDSMSKGYWIIRVDRAA